MINCIASTGFILLGHFIFSMFRLVRHYAMFAHWTVGLVTGCNPSLSDLSVSSGQVPECEQTRPGRLSRLGRFVLFGARGLALATKGKLSGWRKFLKGVLKGAVVKTVVADESEGSR
jgi:hypothetical protein